MTGLGGGTSSRLSTNGMLSRRSDTPFRHTAKGRYRKMLLEGKAYNTLIAEAAKKNSPYNDESKSCIHRTLQHLVDSDTSVDRPGMLLGMVQSGKTKTFLGVIALGLDNGFNLFIVLTTDTKALATQTTKRLRQAFFTIMEDYELRVFYVMALPKLTRYE